MLPLDAGQNRTSSKTRYGSSAVKPNPTYAYETDRHLLGRCWSISQYITGTDVQATFPSPIEEARGQWMPRCRVNWRFDIASPASRQSYGAASAVCQSRGGLLHICSREMERAQNLGYSGRYHGSRPASPGPRTPTSAGHKDRMRPRRGQADIPVDNANDAAGN